MKTNKSKLAPLFYLVIVLSMFGAISYILSPALRLPGESPTIQFPQTISLVILAVCLVSLPPLLLFGGIEIWKNRLKVGLIGNMFLLGLLAIPMYACLTMSANLISWATFPKTEIWTDNTTADEDKAGKTYLSIINQENITTDEFQKAIEPLLNFNKWGFACDDPVLYVVKGLKGTTGTTTPKWEYVVPIGNAKALTTKLLEEAETDLVQNQPSEAASKVRLVLGIGNRVTTPQTLLQALEGKYLANKAIKFIEAHPEMTLTKELKEELTKTQEKGDVMYAAYIQEHKINMQRLEMLSRPNGNLSPYAALTNPSVWNKFNKDWLLEAAKEKQDWAKFTYNHQWEAYLRAGPIQGLFAKLCALPAYGIRDWEELEIRARAIQTGVPSSQLDLNTATQIALNK